jgi:hypothetical protein
MVLAKKTQTPNAMTPATSVMESRFYITLGKWRCTMLAPQVESLTTGERDYGIAGHAVAGEAPIPLTVVLEKEITDNLTNWLDQQEYQAIAEKFYEIGQVGFRLGIPLRELFMVICRWTERKIVSRSPSQPSKKAFTRNLKCPEIKDAAAEFTAFVRHFLIRGYQDAVR